MKNLFLRKLPLVRTFIVRPRLLLALLTGIVLYLFLPMDIHPMMRALLSWDGGVLFYLAAIAIMIGNSDDTCIRKRAAQEDENNVMILLFSILGAGMSLTAIMQELAIVKQLAGHAAWDALALAAATVLLSWLFMQTIFALHYAHDYYNEECGVGGLEFPGGYKTPDYWDFIYFAFIIGTSTATSDINITSRSIRRVSTLQSVIVFFYNTAVLALAINIGASLV